MAKDLFDSQRPRRQRRKLGQAVDGEIPGHVWFVCRHCGLSFQTYCSNVTEAKKGKQCPACHLEEQ